MSLAELPPPTMYERGEFSIVQPFAIKERRLIFLLPAHNKLKEQGTVLLLPQ